MLSTPHAVLAAVASAGHAVFDQTKPYNLQIVGVRSSNTASNTFDDRCYVVYSDATGLKLESWPITTDPGRYWLENPGRVEGTAILKPGQYRGAWVLGKHKGDKPALVQAKPVTVYRDPNRDATLDTAKEETGLFGINLHRAGLNSSVVDKWSAGCQVWQMDADFERFLWLCRQQAAKGKGWETFTYTLLAGA